MMYYIDKPHTWKAKNRLWAEAKAYIEQFENCLIKDEQSLDTFIDKLRRQVEELNQAYPRTKPLKVSYRDLFVSCYSDVRPFDNDHAFTFHILPILKEYDADKHCLTYLKKGGEHGKGKA